MKIEVTVCDYNMEVIEQKTFELVDASMSHSLKEIIDDATEIGSMADYVHDQIMSGFLVSMNSEVE